MANKQDTINMIAEKSGLTKKDSEKFLEAFKETVMETLASGDKVQIVGFGTFEVRDRAEREAFVNPKQPELGKKLVPSKKAPAFKAGKEFKETVNK